jgi:hypothetical protein
MRACYSLLSVKVFYEGAQVRLAASVVGRGHPPTLWQRSSGRCLPPRPVRQQWHAGGRGCVVCGG